MEEQKQAPKASIDGKPSKLSNLLEVIVSVLVCSGLAVAGGYIDVYSRGMDFQTRQGTVFADAFFISGAVCVLFWALLWVSGKGAFDIIIYGVGRFIDVCFHLHPEKQKMPKTYGEYVEAKRAKKKNPLTYFLMISALFLLIGIILSFIYMNEDVQV